MHNFKRGNVRHFQVGSFHCLNDMSVRRTQYLEHRRFFRLKHSSFLVYGLFSCETNCLLSLSYLIYYSLYFFPYNIQLLIFDETYPTGYFHTQLKLISLFHAIGWIIAEQGILLCNHNQCGLRKPWIVILFMKCNNAALISCCVPLQCNSFKK